MNNKISSHIFTDKIIFSTLINTLWNYEYTFSHSQSNTTKGETLMTLLYLFSCFCYVRFVTNRLGLVFVCETNNRAYYNSNETLSIHRYADLNNLFYYSRREFKNLVSNKKNRVYKSELFMINWGCVLYCHENGWTRWIIIICCITMKSWFF